jgi:hypothetical protein
VAVVERLHCSITCICISIDKLEQWAFIDHIILNAKPVIVGTTTILVGTNPNMFGTNLIIVATNPNIVQINYILNATHTVVVGANLMDTSDISVGKKNTPRVVGTTPVMFGTHPIIGDAKPILLGTNQIMFCTNKLDNVRRSFIHVRSFVSQTAPI